MFLQPCWSKVLEPSTQDVKFRLQHKILLSRAREFRLGKVGDPYCPLEGIRVQGEGPMEFGKGPGLLASCQGDRGTSGG